MMRLIRSEQTLCDSTASHKKKKKKSELNQIGWATYWIKYSIIRTKGKSCHAAGNPSIHPTIHPFSQSVSQVLHIGIAHHPTTQPPNRCSTRFKWHFMAVSAEMSRHRQLNLIDNFEYVINIYRSTWAEPQLEMGETKQPSSQRVLTDISMAISAPIDTWARNA